MEDSKPLGEYASRAPELEQARVHILRDPERFDDTLSTDEECLRLGYGKDLEQVGPKSPSVMLRLATSCAGWSVRPTATEFYEAVRTTDPTGRQRAILATFAQEAEWWELIAAWAERAYTIRQLVTALHRSGHANCYATRWINGWAR